jgi:LysM repeat protein
MEKNVSRSRKERILEGKKRQAKARRSKIAGVTLATAIAAGGFQVNAKDAKAAAETYTVQKGDNLYRISKKYETTVKNLKMANNLLTDTIYPGQKLEVPSGSKSTQQNESINEKAGESANDSAGSYTVKKGDNLYRIAQKYDMTIKELKTANNLTSDYIYPGQVLNVPAEWHTTETFLQHAAIYTVVPGDTLLDISKRYNISINELKAINNLKNDMVIINQKLIIMEDIASTKAQIVGAADNFTIELKAGNQYLSLKVPYGTAQSYQRLAGKEVIVAHKNGALINIQ